MFVEYYNMKAMPFQLTPDHHFFFDSDEHKRAFAHLSYGLAQEEGFIVITGEIGAGKTMLVERLWSELDPDRFMAVRVLTTQVSADDLLHMVADGFGIRRANSDKASLLRELERVFAANQAVGRRSLLVIDEVQNLPLGALEELRMLSNLAVHGRAPFQGLLLGQPQFRHMLGEPDLEQLKQRVLASYHLSPLSAAETRGYVEHRLAIAGWHGDPTFDEEAFTLIHKHSGGIPRKINTLCSRVLLAGYLEDKHQISWEMVETVADELGRDLAAGQPVSTRSARQASGGEAGNGRTLEDRLCSIENALARHDRALKLTLEITARLVEAQR